MALSGAATRAEALATTRLTLREAGFSEAAIEARILVQEACGIDATALTLAPDQPIGEEGSRRLSAWTARRLAREPVWRILGRREFWGLPFRLCEATLVPRPDTEALVSLALSCVEAVESPRMLDLGTGSGCILVALLHEKPAALGVGVDRSPEAAATARENAAANGVGERSAFLVGDWAAALSTDESRKFDLVVSNPPYIRAADIATLEPEVRAHDPRAALDGGEEGLDPYAAIFAQARGLLRPEGRVAVEFGMGQGDDVARIAARLGYTCVARIADLAGVERAAAFAIA